MYYRYWSVDGVFFRCKNPTETVKRLEYRISKHTPWKPLCEYITKKQREVFTKTLINHINK